MRRVLCEKFPQGDRWVELSPEESIHVTQVLRLRDGEIIEAMNGNGRAQTVRLVLKKGVAHIQDLGAATQVRTALDREVVPVILEIAILKGDAMDWVIEKAVELGVQKLQPLKTDHTVVQIEKKGPDKFLQRWQKIADQSLKQCGRLQRMEIGSPIELNELNRPDGTLRFLCDESRKDEVVSLDLGLEESNGATQVHVLIGPEGGWSSDEKRHLEKLGSPVSLGPLVLRAETAAVYGISLLVAGLRKRKTVSQS